MCFHQKRVVVEGETIFSRAFTGAITPRGLLGEHEKGCKSQAVSRVIYKLFECYPNIPSRVIAPVTPRKYGVLLLCTNYNKRLLKTKKSIFMY